MTVKINKFNQLNIRSQQDIISTLIPKAINNQVKMFFTDINNFLQYFIQYENNNNPSFYFEILSSENDDVLSQIDKDYQINIMSNATDALYNNMAIQSNDFLNLLKHFNDVLIEIKYPSNIFTSLFNIVSAIKNQTNGLVQHNILITKNFQYGELEINYDEVKYVKLNLSVSSILQSSFSGWILLSHIIIPSSVSSIQNNAFRYSVSLTQIIIPQSVTSIGDYAFGYCSKLEKVSFPSSLKYIGNNIFEGIQKIEILDNIPDNLLKNCNSLAQVTISSSVTSIGKIAFYGCKNLSSIAIPSSVTNIGEQAFDECTKLSQISFSSLSVSIGKNAFEKLLNVSIMDNIPNDAFIVIVVFYQIFI